MRERMLYIKQTRHKNSSGFRTFECGYIFKMEDNKVAEKEMITENADHVHTDYRALYDASKAISINMDITDDGYIRIWSSSKTTIKWGDGVHSSMEIELVENIL